MHEVGGLIISPTRELATQTSHVLAEFLNNIDGVTQMLTLGGNPIETDVKAFNKNGANILVATPGRLEDLLTRKLPNFHLHKSLKSLVCNTFCVFIKTPLMNNFNVNNYRKC